MEKTGRHQSSSVFVRKWTGKYQQDIGALADPWLLSVWGKMAQKARPWPQIRMDPRRGVDSISQNQRVQEIGRGELKWARKWGHVLWHFKRQSLRWGARWRAGRQETVLRTQPEAVVWDCKAHRVSLTGVDQVPLDGSDAGKAAWNEFQSWLILGTHCLKQEPGGIT